MQTNQEEFENWARVHIAHLFEKGNPFLRECNDIIDEDSTEPRPTYQKPLVELFYACWLTSRGAL